MSAEAGLDSGRVFVESLVLRFVHFLIESVESSHFLVEHCLASDRVVYAHLGNQLIAQN